jgi:hypothetical protein
LDFRFPSLKSGMLRFGKPTSGSPRLNDPNMRVVEGSREACWEGVGQSPGLGTWCPGSAGSLKRQSVRAPSSTSLWGRSSLDSSIPNQPQQLFSRPDHFILEMEARPPGVAEGPGCQRKGQGPSRSSQTPMLGPTGPEMIYSSSRRNFITLAQK